MKASPEIWWLAFLHENLRIDRRIENGGHSITPLSSENFYVTI
jgi:hypothetical protein